MADLDIHDHTMYNVWGANLIGCDCFCETCYDDDQRVALGQGCICVDCMCNQNLGALPAPYYESNKNVKPPTVVAPKVATTVRRSGTCRKCSGETIRKGTRGRYPVLCEGCK
jgi:hypothetical protein